MEQTRSLTKQRSPSIKSITPTEESTIPAVSDKETNGDEKHEEGDTKQANSPLLTSHRPSTSTSTLDNTELDNVDLNEDGTEKPESPPGK